MSPNAPDLVRFVNGVLERGRRTAAWRPVTALVQRVAQPGTAPPARALPRLTPAVLGHIRARGPVSDHYRSRVLNRRLASPISGLCVSGKVAGDGVIRRELAEYGFLPPATIPCVAAACGERAPDRQVDRTGDVPGEHDALAGVSSVPSSMFGTADSSASV